jgi:hypothetical protein
MRFRFRAALLALLLACPLACDDSTSAPILVPKDDGPGQQSQVCEPNHAAKCVGPHGCPGGKLCGPDGTYGVCACDGDAGTLTEAGEDGSTPPAADGAPDGSAAPDVTQGDGEAGSPDGASSPDA